MLTRIYPFLDPARIDADLILRLRRLADDAARLQQTRSVSPALLQSAPLIEHWVIVRAPAGIQLVGRVTDHPHLSGRISVTSPLWFADPDGRWIRTLSRFYRLGPPATEDRLQEVLSVMSLGDDDDEDGSSEGTA